MKDQKWLVHYQGRQRRQGQSQESCEMMPSDITTAKKHDS
jgi:hypothetical protein